MSTGTARGQGGRQGLSRRRLLELAGAVSALGLAGLAGNHVLSLRTREGRVLTRALFGADADLRALGSLYLAAFPQERDAAWLLQRLSAEARAAVPAGADADLRGRITALVRSDFAQGYTFELNQWLFARSEGRLWALAAVDADP